MRLRKFYSAPGTSNQQLSGTPRELKHAVHRALFSDASRHFGAGLLSFGLAIAPPVALAGEPTPAYAITDLLPQNGGNGESGFVLSGSSSSDGTGRDVYGAGDFNGDGIDDVVIGQRDSATNRGAYVVFGQPEPRPAETPIADLLTSSSDAALAIVGNSNDFAGRFSVAGAGDVNADGFDDILLGTFGQPAGRVYVIYGNSGGLGGLQTLSSIVAGNGSTGAWIDGYFANGDVVLVSDWIGPAGDINGDGFDDIIVTAPYAYDQQISSTGRVYVIFGQDGGLGASVSLADIWNGDNSAGFAVAGDTSHESIGFFSSDLGDVNGDGIDDFAVSARQGSIDSDLAVAHVIFGRDTGFPARYYIDDDASDGSERFAVTGAIGTVYWGFNVSDAGDINGDGLDDVAIGAPFSSVNADQPASFGAGQVYVVFGRSDGFPAQISIPDLINGDGSTGFALTGAVVGERTGATVDGPGDINGDGIDDLLIGASNWPSTSRGYVVFGRTTGFPANFELSGLGTGDGSEGFVIDSSPTSFSETDNALQGAGDINADGRQDIVLGAPLLDVGMSQFAGRAFVLFGGASDLDNDGVPNVTDNCVLEANVGQRDTDGDGHGNACDADLDNNCIVNVQDLGILRAVFFSTDPDADFNGDGVVNNLDLGLMRAQFFEPPGRAAVPALCEATRNRLADEQR